MSAYNFQFERAAAYVGGAMFYPTTKKSVPVVTRRKGARAVKSMCRGLMKVTP